MATMDPAGAPASPHHRLINKLNSIAALTEEETRAVLRLPIREKSVAENTEVVSEGDEPSESCLVVDGLLCRYKFLSNGGRQIMSFHVPGDLPDLQCLHLRIMDHSLGALCPSTLAFIPHPPLLEATRRHPGLAAALWRDTLIDAAIFREWITSMGRRNARERVAHLMCEIFTKMQAVDLVQGDSCAFPVNQTELSDAMGLSLVHTNRILQDLKSHRLCTLKAKVLTVQNFEGLKRAALFDSTYLHLRREGDA